MQNNSNQQSSNIGPRIVNQVITLIEDGNLTNSEGQVVVDPNISNQRTNQISGVATQRPYLTSLFVAGIASLGGVTTGLIIGLAGCEVVSNKSRCQEIASGVSFASGLSIFLIGVGLILARHASRAGVRVHQAPSGNLPPPDFDLINLSRRISLHEGGAQINDRENTGSGEVRLPSVDLTQSRVLGLALSGHSRV